MSAATELTSAVAPSTSPIPVCAHQVNKLREQISKFAPNCSLAPSLTPAEAEDLLGSLSSGSLPALEESLTCSGQTTPSHNTMATNDYHEFGDSPFRAPLEDEGLEGYDQSASSQWSTGDPSLLFPPAYEQRSEEVESAHSNSATPNRAIDVVALRAVLKELLAKQRSQSTFNSPRRQEDEVQSDQYAGYAEGTAPMNRPCHSQDQGQSLAHPRHRRQQQHPVPYPNANTNVQCPPRAEFVQREAMAFESGHQGVPHAGSHPVGGTADHGHPTPYTTYNQGSPVPSGPSQPPQVSGASLKVAKMVLQALLQDHQPARTNDGPAASVTATQGHTDGQGTTYPEWPPMALRQKQCQQHYQEQQHQHGYTSPHQNAPPQGLCSGPFPVGNTNGPARGSQQEPIRDVGESAPFARLFLSFPMDVPLREVKKMCSRYGAIHSVRSLRPTRPPRAKNCAFVNFYHHSDAQKVVDAVSHAHGVRLEGLEGRVQCRIADAANWPAPRSARKGQSEGGRRNPQPNSRNRQSAQGI